MKLVPFAVVFSLQMIPLSSFACQNGDTTKTLLVLRESPMGEEDAVIGEIDNRDGSVRSSSPDFYVVKTGPIVALKSFEGNIYTFATQQAAFDGERFCYKVIYNQ